jgi:hypothetical protein
LHLFDQSCSNQALTTGCGCLKAPPGRVVHCL